MKSKALFPGGDVGFEGSEPRRPGIDTFEEVVQRRISRRSALGTAFAPVIGNARDEITVPEGYE